MGIKPKSRGNKRKKTKTHVPAHDVDPDRPGFTRSGLRIPKSFVLKKGRVARPVGDLVRDLRVVMRPHTATNLQERSGNSLKDFVHVAGPLGVSHFLIVTNTETSTNLRIARAPRGPTLSFRVSKFSRMADIAAAFQHPHSIEGPEFITAPLVVLNQFGGDDQHVKLMSVMFQNMFPALNIQTTPLSQCRRVVLFHRDPASGIVEMRHYAIKTVPVGVSKPISRLLKTQIPDLSQFEDIADYVLGGGDGGESDAEDLDASTIEFAKGDRPPGSARVRTNKSGLVAQQSAVKLVELGPRLQLQLVKIQEGLCDGKVIYHAFRSKSEKQERADAAKRRARDTVKEARKAKQEAAVAAKAAAKAELVKKNKAIIREKAGLPPLQDNTPADDDAEWYRKEVGEEPEEGLFGGSSAGGALRKTGEKREKFHPFSFKKKARKELGKAPPMEKGVRHSRDGSAKVKTPKGAGKPRGKR